MFGGVVASVFVQFIKNKLGFGTYATLATLLGVSLAAAAGYMTLQHFGLLTSFLQLVTTAGAFYAFFIKNSQTLSAMGSPVAGTELEYLPE